MSGQRNKTETTLISRIENTGTCKTYLYELRRIMSVEGNEHG